jgi:hypothetical protein
MFEHLETLNLPQFPHPPSILAPAGLTKSNLSQSADELHAAIIDSLQTFVGGASQFADITLMVLMRNSLDKAL